MIHGSGIDIIEVSRIRKALQRYGQRFLDRLFSSKEQNYCLRHQDASPHFAGRFAAKEAIVKALGTGFGSEVHWLDIEILNDALGKPVVHFSTRLRKPYLNANILLSISHCKEYATAMAIWTDLNK